MSMNFITEGAKTMKEPTLSVVMSNYNHAQFIGEALEAILSQSYKPIEIIIIDDASTDNSIEIIEQHANKHPTIRLIKNNENMGPTHNGNRLLQIACGDYVYWGASDDKVLPDFFSKSMRLLEKHPQAGLSSTLSYVIDEEGKNKGLLKSSGIISTRECYLSPEKALSVLLKYGLWTQGNTTIHQRKILMKEGGFKPELYSFCDGFIKSVIALKYGACFIPEPLACWRQMESGYHITSSRNPGIQMEIINNATRLMETTYKDLFPQAYVDTWRKKQLSLLNLNIWKASQQGALAALTRLKEADSLFDKLLFAFLKVFAKMEQAFVMLYFFVLYRYFPIQIIRRNVVSFFRRMMLRI